METHYHRKSEGLPQEKEGRKRKEKTVQNKNEAKVFEVRPHGILKAASQNAGDAKTDWILTIQENRRLFPIQSNK